MKKGLAVVLIVLVPVLGYADDVQEKEGLSKIMMPTPITATRDAATTSVKGELLDFPGFVMLAGTQGSAMAGFRARTLIACDQNKSRDLKRTGEYGLAGVVGRSVRVCSYSISNGSIAQDVQFVSGTEVCSGSGCTCNGKPVSAKFHLAPNQFVSQGSGVGVLFSTIPGLEAGLCLKVYGGGDVGVNVSFATP